MAHLAEMVDAADLKFVLFLGIGSSPIVSILSITVTRLKCTSNI